MLRLPMFGAMIEAGFQQEKPNAATDWAAGVIR
jgi:hypothetical protein